MGGVAGPLAVVAVSTITTAKGVFIISCVLMVAVAVLALFSLRAPRRVVEETGDVAWECSDKRAMAAQAALRGLVLSATNVRRAHSAS